MIIDFFSQSFIKYRRYPWNKVEDSIIYLKNGKILQAYISSKDYQRLKKLHGNYFLKKDRISELIKRYKELENGFWNFSNKINRLNLTAYSRKQLLPLFSEYVNLQLQVCAWFRATRPEAEIKAEKILLKQLNKCLGSPKKTQKAFQIITESTKLDTLKRENIDWLKLAKQKKITDEKLLNHAKRYPDFFLNIL